MPVFFKLKKRKDFVRAAKSGISIPTRSIVIQAVLRPEETAPGRADRLYDNQKNRQSRCQKPLPPAPARRGGAVFRQTGPAQRRLCADCTLQHRRRRFQRTLPRSAIRRQKLNRQLNGETACVQEDDQTPVSVARLNSTRKSHLRCCPTAAAFSPAARSICMEAIEIHGVIKGLWLGSKRLLRCHPWGRFGIRPGTAENASRKKR